MNYDKIRDAAMSAMQDHMKPQAHVSAADIKEAISKAIVAAIQEYEKQKDA